MISAENEVGANRALDLVTLEGDEVDVGVGQRPEDFGAVGVVPRLGVQQLVGQLLNPSKHRKAPPIIISGITAQGTKALSSSAAGTRMALLSIEPLATAQTTRSSV